MAAVVSSPKWLPAQNLAWALVAQRCRARARYGTGTRKPEGCTGPAPARESQGRGWGAGPRTEQRQSAGDINLAGRGPDPTKAPARCHLLGDHHRADVLIARTILDQRDDSKGLNGYGGRPPRRGRQRYGLRPRLRARQDGHYDHTKTPEEPHGHGTSTKTRTATNDEGRRPVLSLASGLSRSG